MFKKDLRKIEEVRSGKRHKNFDFSDIDVYKCCTIYYGVDFKLQNLSLSGKEHRLITDVISLIIMLFY